jgi:hypothetical protein
MIMLLGERSDRFRDAQGEIALRFDDSSHRRRRERVGLRAAFGHHSCDARHPIPRMKVHPRPDRSLHRTGSLTRTYIRSAFPKTNAGHRTEMSGGVTCEPYQASRYEGSSVAAITCGSGVSAGRPFSSSSMARHIFQNRSGAGPTPSKAERPWRWFKRTCPTKTRARQPRASSWVEPWAAKFSSSICAVMPLSSLIKITRRTRSAACFICHSYRLNPHLSASTSRNSPCFRPQIQWMSPFQQILSPVQYPAVSIQSRRLPHRLGAIRRAAFFLKVTFIVQPETAVSRAEIAHNRARHTALHNSHRRAARGAVRPIRVHIRRQIVEQLLVVLIGLSSAALSRVACGSVMTRQTPFSGYPVLVSHRGRGDGV